MIKRILALPFFAVVALISLLWRWAWTCSCFVRFGGEAITLKITNCISAVRRFEEFGGY